MRNLNLENVQEAGTGEAVKPGGYVCKFTQVTDVEDKEYLLIEYDIAEGEQKDYYKKLEESRGFWGLKSYRSYKEKALPMFKRMCSAVTKSNPGFIFDGGKQNADEKTLVGKLIGLVLGQEEYEKNDGSVGKRLYIAYECEVDKIRKGDFKVPKLKTLENTSTTTIDVNAGIQAGEKEEIPFD